jgi:hypothetical protein
MKIKIISGGQTGADRAGLDFAIEKGIPHGGWCPKSRKSLDGPLDAKYLLKETTSASYLQRTEWNVRDSDATIVFTLASTVTGGSLKTIEFAKKHKMPCLHVHQGTADTEIKGIIETHRPKLLNLAGSRESKEPGDR